MKLFFKASLLKAFTEYQYCFEGQWVRQIHQGIRAALQGHQQGFVDHTSCRTTCPKQFSKDGWTRALGIDTEDLTSVPYSIHSKSSSQYQMFSIPRYHTQRRAGWCLAASSPLTQKERSRINMCLFQSCQNICVVRYLRWGQKSNHISEKKTSWAGNCKTKELICMFGMARIRKMTEFSDLGPGHRFSLKKI